MNVSGRVKDFVKTVCEKNEFYQNKYRGVDLENWDTIPVLEKEEVLEAKERILDKTRLYSWERTSGSTGKVLEIAWNGLDRGISLIELWEERMKFGITPKSKGCFFHSINYRKYSEEDYVINSDFIVESDNIVSFSKLHFDDENLQFYYDLVDSRKIEWILCHPSTLSILMSFMKRKGLKPVESIKYIELAGEFLAPETKEEFRQFFKTNIRNEYGMREVNGMAYECVEGNLHCLEKNAYIEIIDAGGDLKTDGEEGEICVTGLSNRVMPFIRYRTGDRGSLRRDAKCKCGKESPILKLTAGRTNELVERKNRNPLESVLFFYITEYINVFYEKSILQFRVIQKEISKFEVTLVLKDPTFREDIQDLFIEKAEEYGLTDVEWLFHYADKIDPDGRTNKLAFFINEIR